MGWSIAIFCRIFSHTIKFEYYFDVRLLINVAPLLWNKPNRSTNRLIKCIKLITIYCQSPRAEYTGINASRIQLAQHAIGNIIDESAVGEVVVLALEVVKTRLTVVVITAVTQGIDVPDEGRIRGLFAVSTMHGVVAPRVIGAAAQRDAAGNDDDLWLCADGCTHHSDHLSIFLLAVLMHRQLAESPIFRVTGWNFSLFCRSIRNLDTPSTMVKTFCSIVSQISVFY